MRKHTRRKIWKLVNPIDLAIAGAGITPDSLLNKLRMRDLAAIDAFAKGTATLTEWRDVTDQLNLCEAMAVEGVGPEARPTCEAVQRHLIEAAERYERTGKMGTTGPGIQAMRDLYEWHDIQRQSISRGEYERFIMLTLRRIKSGHPGVVVVA